MTQALDDLIESTPENDIVSSNLLVRFSAPLASRNTSFCGIVEVMKTNEGVDGAAIFSVSVSTGYGRSQAVYGTEDELRALMLAIARTLATR